MEQPDHLDIWNDYVHYAPVGCVTRPEAVAMVSGAITFCRDLPHRFLLVDITGLTGFKPPLIGSRYWIAREWAERSGGAVEVAMVAQPEFIDPEKFGVMVVNNAGVRADVFTRENEARDWLLSGHAAGLPGPEDMPAESP